jgi:hypothetical protein
MHSHWDVGVDPKCLLESRYFGDARVDVFEKAI